jgi:hypothetical protein
MAVVSRFQNPRADIKVNCDDTTLELTTVEFVSSSSLNVRVTIACDEHTWTFLNPPNTNQTVAIASGFICVLNEDNHIILGDIQIEVRGET